MSSTETPPQTLVFVSPEADADPNAAGTHVLIIGVGAYLHLPGGGGSPADQTLHLKQLNSPPVSARGLADWFLKGQGGPARSEGFNNRTTPLATVWMLLSPSGRYSRPDGVEVPVASASRKNIAECYSQWLERVGANPNNIGVFYFCGHGVAGNNDYLLAEDFGASPERPWENAFDITMTARAARRKVAGPLYFFIDACRQMRSEVFLCPPMAFAYPGENDPVKCFTRLMLWATGEGSVAFGAGASRSRFTDALLNTLSGTYAELQDDSTTWVITGEALATQVRKTVGAGNKPQDAQHRQEIEAQIIGSQAFHYLPNKPDKEGGPCFAWSANPLLREEMKRILRGVPLPAAALESIAELVEARNRRISELEGAVKNYERMYTDNTARLAAEPDSELVRKAKALNIAGKFQEAGRVLDQIIDADRGRVASHCLMRAQNWLLQGKRREGLSYYEEAYRLRPDDPQYALPYATELLTLQEFEKAEPVYLYTIAHLRRLSEADQQHYEPELAEALWRLGCLYTRSSRSLHHRAKAEERLLSALSLHRKLAKANPLEFRPKVATTLSKLGYLYRCKPMNLRRSEAAFRLALRISRKLVKEGAAEYLRDVVGGLNNMSVAYREGPTDRLARAEAALEEALDILETLGKAHPEVYSSLLAGTLTNLGNVYRQTRPPRMDEAERTYLRAVEISQQLAQQDPETYLPELWGPHVNLGNFYFDSQPQHSEKAEKEFLIALDINRKLFRAHPVANRQRLARTLEHLAELYRQTKRQDDFNRIMAELRSLSRFEAAAISGEA